MTIYEALNWIKESDDTPYGYLIFNNKPEGQLKGIALKTIYEAAKNDELVPVELFNQIKKERDEAVKNLEAIKQDLRWIPVNERLPEEKINPYTQDYCSYLCIVNFGGVIDITSTAEDIGAIFCQQWMSMSLLGCLYQNHIRRKNENSGH